MTATGNVLLTANTTGGADGSWSLTPPAGQRVVGTAVPAETVVTLINGANTITVPTGATNAIIVPPNAAFPQPNPSYAGTLTLKGVTGDTGVAISNTYLTYLPWDTAPSTFVIAATAVGTLVVRFL